MSNQYIDELTYGSIKKLARYLSLPARCNIASPPQDWFREQEARLSELPTVCLRPAGDSLNMMNLVKRGLMKMGEKQSLPFVPDSAVLCRTHRALNPWRIRCLFALLASEVMDKLERMRRLVRNNSDLAQSRWFRDFVRRMTSVQALWMERATFERLYGYAPIAVVKVQSECEACICAVVGGDTRLLVDLKAHLLSRSYGFQPVLLRVVEAWIDAFEDKAQRLHTEGAVLGEKLRRIRTEVGVRRHHRRQRRRKAGKNLPYSKAKHEDKSTAVGQGLVSIRSSVASGSLGGSTLGADGERGTSRFGHHTPDPSYPRPTHSSRIPGDGPNILGADPFGDEHADDLDDEDENTNENQAGNSYWMEQLGDFYQRQAAQNRDGHGFDTASLHPAFQHSGSRPVAQSSEPPGPTTDKIRYHQATSVMNATHQTNRSSSGRTATAPPPATLSRGNGTRDSTVRDPQLAWEDVSVRSISQSTRPAQPIRATSTSTRGSHSTRNGSQSTHAPPASSASSAYSIPASMIQRESRALSELERLAISTGSSRASRASTRSSSRPPISNNHSNTNSSRRPSISSNRNTPNSNRPASSANRRDTAASSNSGTNVPPSSRTSEAVSSPPPQPVNNRPMTQDPAPIAPRPAPRPSSPAPVLRAPGPRADMSPAAAATRLAWQGRSQNNGGDGAGPNATRRRASQDQDAPPRSRRPSTSHGTSSYYPDAAPRSRRPSTSHASTGRRGGAPSVASSVYSADEDAHDTVWTAVRNVMRRGANANPDDGATVMSGSTRRF